MSELSEAQQAELERLDEVITSLDEVRRAAKRRGYGAGDPWPLFIRKMRMLNPQSWGAKVEAFLCTLHGWKKIAASLDRGDALDRAGKHHEVKATIITASNAEANFVQIRPHQDITGYHMFVVDRAYELHHFILTKAEMAEELALCGGRAHGTEAAVGQNTTTEWAIRFTWKAGNETYDRWMERYLHASGEPCCAPAAVAEATEAASEEPAAGTDEQPES